MRTVTALDVRRRFGEIVDAAAAGERIIIERAGQPMAAIVPLSDLVHIDPDRRKAERLAAIEEMRRIGRRPSDQKIDSAAVVRQQRRERADQVARRVGK
jgi:prevent-host-death family protein